MLQPGIVFGILGGIALLLVLNATAGVEPVTEVWLLDHQAFDSPPVPAVDAGDSEVEVRARVGIRNREGQSQSYQYTIVAYTESGSEQLTTGSVTVADGQAIGIPLVYESAEVLPERTRVEFTLVGRREQVHFWLEANRTYSILTS